MYKNPKNDIAPIPENWVSILVLMELCIKTFRLSQTISILP